MVIDLYLALGRLLPPNGVFSPPFSCSMTMNITVVAGNTCAKQFYATLNFCHLLHLHIIMYLSHVM